MKEEEILGILPLHIRTIIKQADINWDDLQEIRLRIQKPVILKYRSKACYLSEQGKITTRKEQLHIVTSQEIHIRTIIKQAGINWDELQEIRLRIQKPVILKYNAKTCYLSEQGKITTRKEQLHIVTSQEIRQAMEYISSYSMYAYIEQLKQGFLTIRGGHRVGICGTVVMDHDKVKTIRHISGLNIRVAHEVKGCADILYSRCTRMGKLIPTLIISPPGCETNITLLRDMIRKISDEGQTVGVDKCDESEIGACYQGVAQNDLGIQTDVMDACEKGQGMNMLIRSIALDDRCDEIETKKM